MNVYLRSIENLVLEKLKNKTSKLIFNRFPCIFYKVETNKIHMACNQIYLAEKDFFAGTKFMKTKESLIIQEKDKFNRINTENVISYTNKKLITCNSSSLCFNMDHLEDILSYYFFCCINNITYNPYLDETNLNDLINIINIQPGYFLKVCKNTLINQLGYKNYERLI